MFMFIINRPSDLNRFEKALPWVLIIGRRKTGKTFFVKHFCKYDKYFFVRRDRIIFDDSGNALSYESFFNLFKELSGKYAIVIDEFHRLPSEFFDYLHMVGKKGKLIAISSTLWFAKKLIGSGSPLLGLFSPVVFSLISETDIVNFLKHKIKDPRELVEISTYLKEPLLIPKYKKGLTARELISNFLYENKYTLEELIGEIFDEEKRRLSEVYKGILSAVSSGKTVSTKISSFLYSRKLIPKDNPGLIQRYLDVLVKIGLLEKIPVWHKKTFVYKVSSPLLDLHFYLKEKYAYTEYDANLSWIRKVVEEKIPMHVEDFFSKLLSKKYGLRNIKIFEPEVDIALFKFKKPNIIAEVKWKKKLTKSDLEKCSKTFSYFPKTKKFLILPKKKKLKAFITKDIRDFI